jgi:DNA-binding XRE family transcriptional regulator
LPRKPRPPRPATRAKKPAARPARGRRASEEPLCALFGDNLRRARERAGLTQTRLAELAGVGRSDLHKIEAGRRNITLGMASRLATALGIDVRDLFKDPADG